MKATETMTLDRVRALLDGEVLTEPVALGSVNVSMACGADLMSDVLAFIKAEALLLTGLTNAQVVRTAGVADVRAIVFVRSKRPDETVIALANEVKMPMLRTSLPMFEACGRLYSAGLPGCTHETLGTGHNSELHQGV